MKTRFVMCLSLLALMMIGGGIGMAETMSVKKVLSLEMAREVAAAAEAEAKKKDAGGAIAVVDDGGHLLCLIRLDGTFPAAANISIAKARSAAVFRRPTSVFEEAIKNGRLSLVANEELMPLQGGVPITVNGEVIGAVGVAGALSAEHDDQIARAAAAVVH